MQRKFLFFINPKSGTQDKTALKKIIEKKIDPKIISFQFEDTNIEADYKFLPARILKEKITDIIICGGDGTVNQLASSLLGTDVNIGIVPMGSGNGLAFAAGIPRNSGKALEVIVQGNSSRVDAFNINGQFSCMLCGLGFDAQVAHDFAKQPTRGLSTYIKQTVKNFFSATAYPFIVEVNNTQISTEAFFISIANSNQFGNNVTIAPKASLSDGLLDIVIVNKMSKLNMVYSLLKQIRIGKVQYISEKGLPKKGIHYFQAGNLKIQNPSLAPLHIDGEAVATNENFEINVIENAFRLLHP